MKIDLKYLLCQCTSLTELEKKVAELGCTNIELHRGSVHVVLPDGETGRFIWGTRGWRWCGADDAE